MPVYTTHRFKQSELPQQTNGFTLVELMVVIVILSVFAGVVSVSVSGGQKRQQMQYYDKLVDDLKLAKLESLDQARVIGLLFSPENATRAPSYGFLTLTNAAQDYIYRGGVEQVADDTNAATNGEASITELTPDKLWQPEPSFKRTELLPNMRMEVSELTVQGGIANTVFNNTSGSADLNANNNPLFADSSQLPDVLWYGNGEATPVKIQLYVGDNTLGDPIFIDALGRVKTSSLEAGL